MNRAASQTLRVATTLAWEFWACGWRAILLAPLGAVFLPGLVFALLTASHGHESFRGGGSGALLQFGLYWPTVLLLGSAVLSACGNPRLRYTLPASNLILVAAPMACAMATMFVQYAIVAIFLNALFDADWPILGPGLLAAVLIAVWQAVLWSTWNSVGLRCTALLAGGLALVFTFALAAKPHGPKMPGFVDSVDGWGVLSCGLATLACVGAGASGLSRVRHGSGIDVQRIIDWFGERVSFGKAARLAPFSSPPAAQFWLEWTERGYLLPVGTTFFGIAALLAATCAPAHRVDAWLGVVLALYSTFMIGIGLGLGIRSPSADFGSFNGSRPLSDSQLANAILKSMTLALISSAVICAAVVALVVLIVGERLDTSRVFGAVRIHSGFAIPACIALGALAAWSLVGFVTSLALAGGRVISVAILLPFGVWIATFVLSRCVFYDFRREFEQAVFMTCLVCCLLGSGAIYIASWRRRSICKRTLWIAAALALTSGSTAVAAAHFAGLPLEWKYLLPAFGCCGLIPIPLAAAPLAVYVNRHR